MDIENGGGNLFSETYASEGVQGVIQRLKKYIVAVVGKKTCPFCMESKALLEAALEQAGGGKDNIVFLWSDEIAHGATLIGELKKELNHSTVPMIFIGGSFVGGCDAVTKMKSEGVLSSCLLRAMSSAAQPTGDGDAATHFDEGDVEAFEKILDSNCVRDDTIEDALHYVPDEKFQDKYTHPALTEKSHKVIPPLFWFPEVVDNNVVRFTGVQVVIINVLAIIWRKYTWAHYMILGLALDNLGRLVYGTGPSPLGQLARCAAVPLKPTFKPGIPKQFAIACGLTMSIISVIFLFVTGFDPERIIASCFMGVYACLAALEAGINFCMGCYIFGWLVKVGILPKEIYSLCITMMPEYQYTYDDATKVVDVDTPEEVRLQYPGKEKSDIDVRYKAKSSDHDSQSFDIVKYTKASHFNIVLAMLGLASLWRLAGTPDIGNAVGFSISNTPGDVFTVMSVVLMVLFGSLYLARLWFYPKKVMKDWMNPVNSNALVIPPASFVLLAFCVYGRFSGADVLARVLFWIGAPATLLFSIILAARWITDAHSEEHINAGWLLIPSANFVCALVAPRMDGNYLEAAYLWFSFGVAIGIPVYVITLHKSIVFNDPDDRLRLLKWSFVALTSVACVGNTFLTGQFSSASKILYFVSISLALVLGCLYLTGHQSQLKFDPTSTWSVAFPLEALAIATCVYAANVQGTLPQGMAYAGLGIASWTVATLFLQTVFSILMKKFFTMDQKYGPLSQQILTHEAFRGAAGKLHEALKMLNMSGHKINPGALQNFALLFRRFRLVHTWHAVHEEEVIFKEFEKFVPGACSRQHKEHHRDEILMQRWNACLEILEGGEVGKPTTMALDILQKEIPQFLIDFEDHLQGEEMHLQRLGRKSICYDLQKDMIRRIWDMTPIKVWEEFLPFVVQNVPMHQQRVKFVRAYALWSVPERAQLIGRCIALGTDPAIWEKLVESVPEIAPRGEKRWRRYY